jgi:lipopolysaccharide biosynthesis glycosyltransferase
MTGDVRTCAAFAVNEAYALPLAVAGRSLIENYAGDEPLEIEILDLGISEPSRDRIVASWPASVKVNFLRLPPGNLDGLPISDHEFVTHLNRNVYGRWFLPELLPAEYRRMIYIDADVLVLRDVSRLWDVELDGRPFAAAQDKGIPYVSSRYGVPDYQDLGLSPHSKYFNAGVMVIDPERWQDLRIRERALRYARTHPSMRFADQEALNAVAGGIWSELSAEWNCPVEDELLGENHAGNPRIIHFLGPQKPWLEGSSAPHCQLAYMDCLRRTQWAQENPAY